MFDTHCHLSYGEYDNIEELIKEMKENSISAIVNGTNKWDNDETILLSNKFDNIYAAIGFHPQEIENVDDDYIEYIEKNINSIVAIGEIGLDYYWNKNNKEQQKEIFQRQLKIAEMYNIPVIVHSRDAIQDTYDILKKYKVVGIIHSFSGSLEMANKFIDLGFKLGIGGVITFKNCNLKDVINKVDINNIVLETDSPYLSPEPVRGKKNSPLNLKYIVEFISNLKGITTEEVINATNESVWQLFDL